MAEDLAALQAWMQGRVMSGAPQAGGAEASEVVVSSSVLSADQRISIYARSYGMRLIECLRAEFPALRLLIGDQVFNLFAGGYLAARPSTSYSLYDLGAGFAEYLDATRPRPRSGPGTMEALPSSLARLERAISEVGRAPGVEDAAAQGGLDAAAFLLDPARSLRLPPSVRLLKLDFDFAGALASVEAGERPALPPARSALVAVARSRYRVRMHELEPWSFAWLEGLGDDGGDAQRALAAAAQASGIEAGAVLGRVLVWLPAAIEAGLVAT